MIAGVALSLRSAEKSIAELKAEVESSWSEGAAHLIHPIEIQEVALTDMLVALDGVQQADSLMAARQMMATVKAAGRTLASIKLSAQGCS